MGFFDFFSRGPMMQMYDEIRLRTNADLINSEYLAQPWNRYQALADEFNKAYQKQLYNAIPGLDSRLTKYGSITDSFQRGEVPGDTRLNLQKDAAYLGLAGRGVGGGEMTNFDVLQNLGLTRLELQQQGQNYASSMLDMARAMTPEGTGSQFRVDFGTLANRIDQEAFYNNNIRNQNKQIAYYNAQKRSPFERLISNTIGSIVSAPFNMLSSVVTAPFNAISGAANMFAGGLAGGLAQQGLGALGFGGQTGLGGGGGFGGFGGLGGGGGGGGGGGMGGGWQGFPTQPLAQFQSIPYQMLGSGPMMQSATAGMQELGATNPLFLGANQQKFLTTAPTGASTMPVVMGGGTAPAPFYDPGYSFNAFGGGGIGRGKPMNMFEAYGDFLGNAFTFGTQSRTNAGSAFGN